MSADVAVGARALLASPGLRLAGRRLLATVPVLVGVTLLSYGIVSLLPGNAAQQLLGAGATPPQTHALSMRLHLDEPFVVRYIRWLVGALHGDLGSSLSDGQPVSSVVAQRFPPTFELVLFGFFISVVFAVPVAVVAARRPNGVVDRLTAAFSLLGLSAAPYVLALVLVLVFAVFLRVLPAFGYVPLSQSLTGNVRSLTLPAVSIGFPLFCFYTRLLRADMVAQSRAEEYVVTARAKGAGPWRVLIGHVLRNSLFGLFTVVSVNLGTVIGATVIIEQIFSIPGIGQELLHAINTRDVVVVEAITMVFALVVVLANLLGDMLQLGLDPRIRHDRAG